VQCCHETGLRRGNSLVVAIRLDYGEMSCSGDWKRQGMEGARRDQWLTISKDARDNWEI